MEYGYVTYLDASAAVKLVVVEPGSDNVRAHFQGHPPHYMTSLCFAETLGVLKRKMDCKQLSREHYFDACYLLIAYLTGRPLCLHLDDTINISLETFMQAEGLAQKHNVDLSDALQIVSLKHGKKFITAAAQESKTVLATADGDLEKAAKKEGLRVWNVLNTTKPPDY